MASPEELMALAGESIALSKAQQKTYRASRHDDGKRDPHSLFTNMLFHGYVGIITEQLGLLVDLLLKTHSPADLHKRRVRLLSIVFSFIDRFASLPTEESTLVDARSIIPKRGTLRG